MRTVIFAAACLLACKGSSNEESKNEPLIAAARECTKDAELACPRPIFAVRDVMASLAYYRDSLGFKIDWTDGEPADFASVTRAHATFFVGSNAQGVAGNNWAWVFARDVDALHKEIVAKGAIIKMPPTNMPWGIREMHVADRDGNVIRFGSEIEH